MTAYPPGMYRYGAALALLALASAGCSDEQAGTLPPPSPVTTSATPSPSPTNLRSEIDAAARAYFAALERAGKTGDVPALRALLAPTCECVKSADYIQSEHAAGHRFTTIYRVEAVSPHDVTPTSGAATVTVTYAASKVVDTSGRTVRTLPGETHAGRELAFAREGGRWLVTRVVLLPG